MQDDSADQIFEELQDIVQQAILREFPNPERKGCPGPAVLRELANRPRPTRDAAWEHVTHCSPCYREFLDARAIVLARRRARRRLRTVAGIALVAIATVAIWFAVNRRVHRPLPSIANKSEKPSISESGDRTRTLTAVLNMQASSAPGTRGAPEGGADLQHLPRARMAPLLIYLPLGSDPGKYTVEIRPGDGEPPTATLTGTAEIRDGLTVLRATVDLSRFSAGTYIISVSRDGNAAWICRFLLP
jgi:hypothetical protein